MDLRPLYTLKDALENTAVTGTDALIEDYPLQSAIAAFAPLSSAVSAFGRIGRESVALLAAEPDERPARLGEALWAVTSAARRLGTADVPGDLTPLAGGDGNWTNASYSRLHPLIDALCGSGAGRISLVEETYAAHPEYFSDFRVMPYLVDAICGAHGEWEEVLASILSAQGRNAVAFLEAGFEPDGRREMARRVYWAARLGGAETNEWLLSILPSCTKEAREMAVAALGVSQENAALLRELYRTESGKCRDAALRALARMEDAESRALWEEELEIRSDCPPCLEGVDSPLAADMAARAMRSAFEEGLARGKQEFTRSELLTLAHGLYAACGKYSDSLREVWLWCAEHIREFDAIRPDNSVSHWDLNAAEMLEKCLLETVLWNPCEGVRSLAQELGEKYPAWFLGAGVLYDLLAQPAETFDRYGKLIVRTSLLRRESAAERANRVQIMRALAAIRHTKEEGRHIPFFCKDALSGAPVPKLYRVRDLDPRWAEALGSAKVNQDGAVFDLGSAWTMNKIMFQLDWIT